MSFTANKDVICHGWYMRRCRTTRKLGYNRSTRFIPFIFFSKEATVFKEPLSTLPWIEWSSLFLVCHYKTLSTSSKVRLIEDWFYKLYKLCKSSWAVSTAGLCSQYKGKSRPSNKSHLGLKSKSYVCDILPISIKLKEGKWLSRSNWLEFGFNWCCYSLSN
jgi:hypothetical protein